MKFRHPFYRHNNSIKATVLSIAAFTVVSLTYSCSDPAEAHSPAEGKTLEFNSAVTGYGKTRVNENQWDEQDLIGTFMFESGQAPSASSGLAHNHCYITDGDGLFIPQTPSDRLALSQESPLVDIIAYYPYSSDLDGYTYRIDICDQTVQEELDILYSNNITALGFSSTVPPLSFSRQMSKVVFNITNSGEGGASALRNLDAKVVGVNTRGELDLLTGQLTQDVSSVAVVEMHLLTTLEGRTAQATLMPTSDVSDIKFIFTLGEEKYTIDFPAGKTLEKGGRLIYSIVLNSEQPPVVEPVNGWVELPAAAHIENTEQVTHYMSMGRNFSLLYDKKYMIAYWVAYPLVSAHIGNSGRSNAWGYDPYIATQYQADIISRSYPDGDYDRGHQIPSGDRTLSYAANAQTFYSTNMTPQNYGLNRYAWANLETQVRTWANRCDTLYVVTGAILPDESQMEYVKDNSNKNIAKPTYYYKALARRVGNTYSTVAYKYENVYTVGTNYDSYKLSVKDLEDQTGFTFFPALSDEVKSNTSVTDW